MTTKEEANSSTIAFKIGKNDFKKALSVHKRFSLTKKDDDKSPLGWIEFTAEKKEVFLATTDGAKALITKIGIMNPVNTSGKFCLSMAQCSKLSFLKGEFDTIDIQITNDKAIFTDDEFKQTQILALMKNDKENNFYFPDIKNVIPKDTNFKVSISTRIIKDIGMLKSPKGYVDLLFNTKNASQAILIEVNSEDFSEQAIVMPVVQIDEV